MKFLIFLMLLTGLASHADNWQVQLDKKLLNGKFVEAGTDKHIYLIVHGTWAHYGMEIIDSLQNLLEERDQSSLAITLSLGLSDRSGFMQCDNPVYATQDMAVEEIQLWVDTLRKRGFEHITIIGHSRGSSQVAMYENRHPGNVRALVLLAPSVFRKELVSARYNNRSDVRLEDVLNLARSSKARLIGPYPLVTCDSVLAPPNTFLSYYGNRVKKNTPALVMASTVPVHIIQGSEDVIVQWTDQHIHMAENNPRVLINIVDGAGHFFRDLYLDDVVDLILGDDE